MLLQHRETDGVVSSHGRTLSVSSTFQKKTQKKQQYNGASRHWPVCANVITPHSRSKTETDDLTCDPLSSVTTTAFRDTLWSRRRQNICAVITLWAFAAAVDTCSRARTSPKRRPCAYGVGNCCLPNLEGNSYANPGFGPTG